MAVPSRSSRARPSPAPPADPFATPLRTSRLPAAAALGRVGSRIGLRTVRDLLLWLPRRYEDLRTVHDLGSLRSVEPGTVVSTRARVVSVHAGRTSRRGVDVVTARLADGTGTAEAQWYGRQFVDRRLAPGAEYIFSGKLKQRGPALLIDNPAFQAPDGDLLHVGRIVPVYPLTAGLALRSLRAAIRAALDRFPAYREYLPGELLRVEHLVGIVEALEQAHFPDDFGRRDAALRRLAFDELLALQVGMVSRRRQRAVAAAIRVRTPATRDAAIRGALAGVLAERLGRPVALTPDQGVAMSAVREDMAGAHPMLRLLQGDVGSGKTAVAAYALALAAGAGVQGALLAPTDLLARQHAATIGDLLAPLGIPVTLLTGSLSGAGTTTALEAMADGRAQVIVGTHALFSDRVRYARLGLVVVDEQHRFGVEQRGALESKTTGGAAHVLLMTATPIPRTLGQVLYADLDVTDLRTAPAGRVPIRTGIKHPDDLAGTWDRVRAEAGEGRRTMVVVPRIDETQADGSEEVAAAEAEYRRLEVALAPLRVGLVHGRQKAVDRDVTMSRFRDGALDVLVGTTVVEVGVDVPEATMMIVEGADRFGLAQLHQLRGRVGRGTVESFCVLVSDAPSDSVARLRLEAVRGYQLTGSRWPSATSSCGAKATSSASPRAACPAFAWRRWPGPTIAALATAARRHAEALLDATGAFQQAGTPFAAELVEGWLARVFAGDPATGA